MAAHSLLFESVCFYILEDYMDAEKKTELLYKVRSVLLQGGGIEETFISGLVTHVIADNYVEDRESVLGDDCTAPIIHSKWALLSSECHVLLPLAPFEMHTEKLFHGVCACPTGLSKSDRNKLCALVLYYGGRFHSWMDENTTHLIACRPIGEKYKAAREHNVMVVQPEWVLDCIKYNKLLPESDYPLEEQEDERSLVVETMSVTRTSMISLDHPETNGVKRMKLSLNYDGEDVIAVKTVEETPDDHSPNSSSVVESSVPMEEQEPVRSRYEVLERVLLKNSESPASTFAPDKDSVAATPQPIRPKETRSLSEGTDSKRDQETLLQGMVFTIVDYPELLDKLTISKWKEVIRQHGGETLDRYDPKQCTHLLSQNKCSKTFVQAFDDSVCVASAHWLNDVLSEQKMFPPRNPLHYPVAFKETPEWCKGLSLSITNYVGAERDLVRDMIRMAGIPYTGHLSRSATHLVCKRPEGRKYDKAREWGVKVVNPVFVSDIMHNGIPTVAVSDRYSRLGEADEFLTPCPEMTKLLMLWQPFITKYSSQNPHLVDHTSCQSCFDVIGSALSPDIMAPDILGSNRAKRFKLSESDSPKDGTRSPVVMFTGFNPGVIKNYKSICKSLGAKVTSDPSKCTHLIASRVARTIKFLCAISVSSYILTPKWLEECDRKKQFVDELPFSLCDKEAEEMFAMDISLSLERAKERRLLNGIVIHPTDNVVPNFESLKLIVESAGGKAYTQSELNSVYGRNFERLATDGRLLIVISCAEDVSSGACREFYKRKIPVYNAEFILTGVLRQSLNYDQNQLTQ